MLIPHGPANLAPADGGIAVTIGVAVLWTASTRRTFQLPYAVGTLTLAMAGLVAGFVGRWPGLALSTVFQDVFLLIWAAALVTIARTPRAIDVVLRAWTLSAPAWAVAFVIATTGSALASGPDATRPGFVLGDSNGAGLYFALSLLLLLATSRPRRPILRLGAATILIVALLYTGSLGGLSGILIGVAFGLVLGVRARRGIPPAVAVAAALVLAAASVTLLAEHDHIVSAAHNSANPILRDSLGRTDQSSGERAVLRSETFELWRESDLIGSGPATTKNLLGAEQAPYRKEAHNDWYAVLVERGVVGILGLLLLAAELINRGWRISSPRRLSQPLRKSLPHPGYLVGALACVLVFSTTHEVLHDRNAWTIFALVAAISIWGRADLPVDSRTGGTR